MGDRKRRRKSIGGCAKYALHTCEGERGGRSASEQSESVRRLITEGGRGEGGGGGGGKAFGEGVGGVATGGVPYGPTSKILNHPLPLPVESTASSLVLPPTRQQPTFSLRFTAQLARMRRAVFPSHWPVSFKYRSMPPARQAVMTSFTVWGAKGERGKEGRGDGCREGGGEQRRRLYCAHRSIPTATQAVMTSCRVWRVKGERRKQEQREGEWMQRQRIFCAHLFPFFPPGRLS